MTYYIYTLGCKVNTYESNFIEQELDKNGFKKGSKDNSDIYIINTCAVTNTAESKSRQIINRCKNNKHKIIVVCGCLSQLDKVDADILIGNKDKSKIVQYLKEYKEPIKKLYDLNKVEFEDMKLDNFDKTRAFVKIEDGCNNYCSYCIIPYTRGGVRSKDKDIVLEEINNLVNNGHLEVVLTGIHTGHYNIGNYKFNDLLKDIVKIKKLKRLRISSIEINELNDDVLETIKNNNIIVNHLHIPLQSGSDEILKLMNRKYDKEYFINRINEIRKIRPDISITTDVIVGFPNETDELFNETIDTINKIKFSKIHVFPYSKKDGTKAALMDNQIIEKVKKERTDILLELSKKLEIEYMNKFIDKKVTIIPEVCKNGYLIGHTDNYLLVKCLGNNGLHTLVDVKIESIDYPYCIATIDF